MKYLGLLDMLNGGGAGRAGSEFEGGIFSELLNELGIRPFGSGRAMAASPRPVARPAGLGAPPPRPAPPTTPPVETSQLGPSMEEIMAALLRAPRGPQAFGAAPPPVQYPTLQEMAAIQEAQRRARMGY